MYKFSHFTFLFINIFCLYWLLLCSQLILLILTVQKFELLFFNKKHFFILLVSLNDKEYKLFLILFLLDTSSTGF